MRKSFALTAPRQCLASFAAILGILIFSYACSANAESSLSIGFPEFEKNMDLLTSKDAAATFLRRATLGRLADAAGRDSLHLVLSDGMTTSADRLQWSFRLSPHAKFSNDRPVLPSDVEYSLERCRARGDLESVSRVETFATNGERNAGEWVQCTLHDTSIKTLKGFPAQVSACPILERASADIFGKNLGLGTNLVSAGEYAIVDFKAGREFTLKRESPVPTRVTKLGAEQILVRAFKEDEAALAALRAGTIDAFLSSEQQVIERAKKDETLLAFQCPIYTVILRKGLKISCVESVLASEIRYSS